MTDSDEHALAKLATDLGAVAGALVRPAVVDGLVQRLRDPAAAALSSPAIVELHRTLGTILEEVQAPTGSMDVVGMAEARRLITQLRAHRAEASAMEAVLGDLCVQLWGPPHPDADYPRNWTDLPSKLAEELEEDDALRTRLSELLTGVAAGLKGPPQPLHGHDWSDLPTLAGQIKDERNLFRHGHRIASDNCVRLEGVVGALAVQLKAIKEHTSGFAAWWGMFEAHQELAGKPIGDLQTVLHFMGSGASTAVTALEIRRMLDTIYGIEGSTP